MKITATKIYKFSVPTGQTLSDEHTGELICSTSKAWLFFKIETDAGISGWGEGSGEWLVPAVEATLKEWQVLLIGRDPLQYREITEDIENRLPWKGGPVFGTAIAAIDALDDAPHLPDLLTPLTDRHLEILKSEPHPCPNRPWKHLLYLEFPGSASDPEISVALTELQTKTKQLWTLGSYPEGRHAEPHIHIRS